MCIRKIHAFRNEHIHNGVCELVETFTLVPNLDESGNFICSGLYNRFYIPNNKINVILFALIMEVVDVLSRTIDEFQKIFIRQIKERDVIQMVSCYLNIMKNYYSQLLFKSKPFFKLDNRESDVASLIKKAR